MGIYKQWRYYMRLLDINNDNNHIDSINNNNNDKDSSRIHGKVKSKNDDSPIWIQTLNKLLNRCIFLVKNNNEKGNIVEYNIYEVKILVRFCLDINT